MVPYPYGPVLDHLRNHIVVEPAPRCSRARVAHWVLRDRVRNARGHSRVPFANLTGVASALAPQLSLAHSPVVITQQRFRSAADSQTLVDAVPHAAGNGRAISFRKLLLLFALLSSWSVVLFNKMRLRVMGSAITLRRKYDWLCLRVDSLGQRRAGFF